MRSDLRLFIGCFLVVFGIHQALGLDWMLIFVGGCFILRYWIEGK